MGFKPILILGLFLVMDLLISTEVVAVRELAETSNTDVDTRGGYGGYPGGGYLGGGHGGYPGSGRGGYPGGGRGGYCRYGCCGQRYYGGCRCCSYAGQAVDATEPQN